MAGSSPEQNIFDVQEIRRLVELMKEYDLSQIDLRQGERRIQLRRGGDASAGEIHLPPASPAAGPMLRPADPMAGEAGPPKAEAVEGPEHVAIIRSPMVGTFYSAADPDSPPFVKVGDHVGPDTTVCIVEAMKVFNQIPAEVSGKITAVLIENGEPVEFGQPVFKVDTRE